MPGRYFNVPYDCFGGAEPPAAVIDNQVEFPASRVGGWGGDCTCPDGSVYQVGDNYDGCRSLACVGGTSGQCNRRGGPWSRRKVTCGIPDVVLRLEDCNAASWQYQATTTLHGIEVSWRPASASSREQGDSMTLAVDGVQVGRTMRNNDMASECNDDYCTSHGQDCCAPESIHEPATCSNGYLPVRKGQGCWGYSEGVYTCCHPDTSDGSSQRIMPVSCDGGCMLTISATSANVDPWRHMMINGFTIHVSASPGCSRSDLLTGGSSS